MKKYILISLLFIITISAKAQRDTPSPNYITATVYTPTLTTSMQSTPVQRALLRLTGVTAVNIDLTGRQINVTYNPLLCNKQLIKETIYNLGYSADEMHYYPPVNDTLVGRGKIIHL